MTKRETILTAGKQIAAIASGRAYKETAEDILNDPSGEQQGESAPPPATAPSASVSEPENSNEVDHDRQQPDQGTGGH